YRMSKYRKTANSYGKLLFVFLKGEFFMKSRICKNIYGDEEFKEGYNPYLKQTLLEVVENQLRDNDPPMTRITFERLKNAGYTEQQAKEKIAAVVVGNLYDTLKYQKPFDGEQYCKELSEIK
ncbi:MAG: DUF1841 family protein, partial [Prevotella sp.]|nr:DUF1841 family protein [Prevotella sp.]